jgi:hypothetical protein
MRNRARGAGFAALFALLVCTAALSFYGCGGTKPTTAEAIERYSQKLRNTVLNTVSEEGRRSQMLLIVDRLEALNVRFGQETADFIESYRALNSDYEATRDAFEHLFSGYSAKRVKARDEALNLHFQLASLATADEWDAIGKAEIELYEEVHDARPADGSTK